MTAKSKRPQGTNKRKQGAAKARTAFSCFLLRNDYLSDVAHSPNYKPVAVIPCATLKQARALVKFAGMTDGEMVERVAKVMQRVSGFDWHPDYTPDLSRAVLRSLGLMEEGK